MRLSHRGTNMNGTNYISKLKEMFQKMVVEKNASLINAYYHPELLVFTNNKVMTFEDMVTFNEEVYKTPIQYAVAYDEDTLLEQENKVAGRIFITTSMPNEKPTEIEVILIVTYKEDKIHRAWELTYPNWIEMSEFEKGV
jgi:hypothetical protein